MHEASLVSGGTVELRSPASRWRQFPHVPDRAIDILRPVSKQSPGGKQLRSSILGLSYPVLLVSICRCATNSAARGEAALHPQEVMIPVRDGVHLQTAILTPCPSPMTRSPLPILFRRTPYGVPEKPPEQMPSSLKELAQDGYIFVIQNLRGRFKSEGVFNLSSWVDLNDPKATNETTDAYDSIEWLVKNVPNNNGKVGMYGVSYDGLTTALTLLHPHPALKAISEQASPVDQWMNDDDHRYGALRESYDFEYAVMEQADKNKNTHFDFETYDTYQWYLDLGPLSNINTKYLHGSIPYWNSSVEHPDYDEFWKKEAWVNQLHASTVPNLNVAGFWDQEDPWGPWQIFRHAEENDPQHTNFMVAGPWFHGEWQSPQGRQHRPHSVRRPRDRARIPREYRGAVLPLLPARQGREAGVAGQHISERIEHLAHLCRVASERSEADQSVSARRRHALVHRAGATAAARRIASTFPIPPIRCLTASARFRRLIPRATGAPGKSPTSASSIDRPDVLSFVSAPLDHDLTVTGPLAADLFASTSGTDSDFVVKLIDVYPQDAQKNAWNPDEGPKPGQYAQSLNGYELPIAMEVRRGRYLASYEKPHAAHAEQTDRVEHPSARSRPRLSERPPHHGADSVDMVSGDRPQSAEIRAQHLQGDRV